VYGRPCNPHFAATHRVIRAEKLNKSLLSAYGKSLDIEKSVPPSFSVPPPPPFREVFLEKSF
jgi:hypothetical protein